MSTLAAADLPSDEEGDADFVPSTRPAKKRKITNTRAKQKAGSGSDSDSGSSDSSSDDENGGVDDEEAKKLRAEVEAIEAEERKRKAAEAFAAFKDEATPGVGGVGGEKGQMEGGREEMVAVKRQRKFAGEVIHETVMLPKSHPEAIAFLATTATASADSKSVEPEDPPQGSNGTSESTPTLPTAASSSSTAPPPSAPKPAKGPPKRKPRQSLEAMSAGLSGGKKMTTLEKSQMDWKSHVASSSNVADELETNRRSGGFLEKRDFLDRVGDRRTETMDSKRKGR